MAEARNTRRDILKKLLTLGPLAALAGAFGVNGPKTVHAQTYNEDVTVNSPYRLGIGMSPTAKLDIQGAGTSMRILGDSGNASIAFWAATAGDPGGLVWVNDRNGNTKVQLSADSGVPTSYFNNGNVGIGTTGPGYLLHVKGMPAQMALEASSGGEVDLNLVPNGSAHSYQIGANIYGWYVYDSTSAGYRLTVDPGGNLGVGTSAPAAKLHVVGDVNISGDIFLAQGCKLNGNAQAAFYSS